MKLFAQTLAVACLLWVIAPLGRADLPASGPRSTTLTVSGIADFKDYKFFYSEGGDGAPVKLKPLTDGKRYNFFDELRLFVQGRKGEPEQWRNVRAQTGSRFGAAISVKVASVHEEKGKIVVRVAADGASVSEASDLRYACLPFGIGALGICGLVVLGRRRG